MSASHVETAVQAPQLAPAERLMQMSLGYMTSIALHTAVQLAIAERLADGPRPVTELAREAGANEDALFRLLRLLAGVGVFEETSPRQFGNTELSTLMRADTGSPMRHLVDWIANPFHFEVYAQTLSSVKTGETAVDKVTGVPVFEHFARTPALSEVFNHAMTSMSSVVIPAVLEAYDFAGIDKLVDVAGGHGRVLTSILMAYPRMSGVLFDLPYVVEGARPEIARLDLGHRCRAEAGDMFAGVPAGGDAYIMKHIIHDWDDERAIAILRNIRTALGDTLRGKVLLLESVIEPGNAPDMGKFIDLEMLLMTGGRERTEEEFRALFAAAGFELTRIIRTNSPLSIVEAEAR